MEIFNTISLNWELICIAFGVLVNLAGFVFNITKLCRAGRGSDAETWLALIEAARVYEQEAEGFVHYTSAEKLQYVLSRLRVFTAELGCGFDEERLIEQISADIAFSKAVNAEKGEGLD